MSKLFKSTANTQTSKKASASERYWASDAVERIAKRTPTLFKKNAVPVTQMRRLNLGNMPGQGAS